MQPYAVYYTMKIWLYLLLFHSGIAEDKEEFFPDKPSVITNEHLAFYEREDFYLITVPCAVAAIFVICCVLCCTLYAREGVCHLFDFPDELRRHASGEHFLTVDEFLELERRHRLGLPVESLLELQNKRRSEAEAGVPPLDGDVPAEGGDWQQQQQDVGPGQTEWPAEYNEYDMSGQPGTRQTSSVADMRPPQEQWSAPRTRRSMSLDRAVPRTGEEYDNRQNQQNAPYDAPMSPGASPMRYDEPPSQQGSDYPRQPPSSDQRYQDLAAHSQGGYPAAEPVPIPLNAVEDPRRMAEDDPRRSPMEYRQAGPPQDGRGTDGGYGSRSDPDPTRPVSDRRYDNEGPPVGSGRPADMYDQRSLRSRASGAALPPSEAYDRSPHVDQRDYGSRERLDRTPMAPGVGRQYDARQGPDDGLRYPGQPPYGSTSASALDGRRAPSKEGIMIPAGMRAQREGIEPDMSAREQEYPQQGTRPDLERTMQQDSQRNNRQDQRMGSLEDQRRGAPYSENAQRYPPEQPLQRRASSPHRYPDAVDYREQDRYRYSDQHLPRRTPSGVRPGYNDFEYQPHDVDPLRRDPYPRGSQIRAYNEVPRPQEYASPEPGLQYEQPASRRASRGYDYVDHGYPPQSDVMDRGYQRGDVSSRVPSQHSISGRRLDPRLLPDETAMVDQFGRPIADIRDARGLPSADVREVRGLPPRPDYARQGSVSAERTGSRQWVIGPDGRRYMAPSQLGRSGTPPSPPGPWPDVHSPRMEFRADGPVNSRIFGHTVTPVPVGIYGETTSIHDPAVPEYASRQSQQQYDDRYRDDARRPAENGWQSADAKGTPADPQESRREERPSPARPSGLLQRVRSVSVSRMSHSLRQMVSGERPPSSRSKSEEPRGDLAGDGPRGSAAWLLHRIRSLRGVSEQPAAARSGQRQRQERRSDRLNRSHGPQDSLAGSDGGVSGAADWPSSVEDLEEGEYVSPSRRAAGEGSRHPTPVPDGVVSEQLDNGLPTEPHQQSPKQAVDDAIMKSPEHAVTEKQPSPEKELPIQYVLEEHAGRKRIIAVSADHPEINQYPPSDALEPPTTEKRAASDYSDHSDQETAEKKEPKKRKSKVVVKQRSEESANGSTKKKKAKSKKKKKKHSRKRSKSSRSSGSSSTSSHEDFKKSKRHRASLCRDSDQSESDDSEYTDESVQQRYDDYRAAADNDKGFTRSASRESLRASEPRYYQGGQRDSRFSERTSYSQQAWRPHPGYYQQQRPRPSQAVSARSRWESRSPVQARSETPPDREPTPERGRSELNRHGQPRHRPVVFQNESLRAFVSQPSRRAMEQRGRPPRTGRGGGLPSVLRRPFQTNQSFIPWQQYPESPQRGRAPGVSPGRSGPRTPPLPSPPPLSPSTTPPRPSASRVSPRPRPVRTDPRTCVRNPSARAAAARECQMRNAVLGSSSREDIGCTTRLKRFFDE